MAVLVVVRERCCVTATDDGRSRRDVSARLTGAAARRDPPRGVFGASRHTLDTIRDDRARLVPGGRGGGYGGRRRRQVLGGDDSWRQVVSCSVGPKILVIDNYDSFVYNLVQYLGELGADPVVYRNDAIDLDGVAAIEPAGIVISPGPGRPEDAGISVGVVKTFAGQFPLLGVCLGHQAIGHAFGAHIVRAPELLHGKTSELSHDGRGIFEGLPQPLTATRYHSLVVDRSSLDDELEVSAWAQDGTVMGLRHKRLPVEGVQFHPEAVLTAAGHQLLGNWLALCS
jgi:anthranilate synthase/aminodeoxychorismate synthase-like glutamine amidotransferase